MYEGRVVVQWSCSHRNRITKLEDIENIDDIHPVGKHQLWHVDLVAKIYIVF